MITIKVDKSKHLNDEYSIYVSFPYDIKLVNFCRAFTSRYWIAQDKCWELSISALSKFIESFPNESFDISGTYVDLSPKAVEIPTDFNFKTKPFQHQIEGFEYGMSCDRWLLGDEQGLGKTKQVIDIAVAKKYQKGYKHCLIICGVNGLKWNWLNEVHTHSNEEAHILGMKQNGKIGSTNDKYNDLSSISDDSSYFIITNVESLRDDKIASKISELCENGTIGLVAIDEIHKCKNPSSQQGKGILKVDADCKIAMTGTPLMNNPLDLYIILKWLGYEKHAFYSFKNHYCVMGGYGNYQIVGYKNLEELQERLSGMMLRRLKDDVLDLPEKTFINEYVELTPKQMQIYREVKADIKSNIDKIKVAPNPLASLIRMRQATGYTGILSSEIQESAKLDRMEELVEETIENHKKVVIFSNWTQMTDVIYDRLRKYNPAIITGETKDDERMSEVSRFQNDSRCNVIIGTTGAMGTGLTLTAGTVEIFLDEPWTMAAKSQAVDRCHRIGQKNNITVYTLMAKGTIDEKIHNIVHKKGEMSDTIVDGKVVGSKSEVLEYLLD